MKWEIGKAYRRRDGKKVVCTDIYGECLAYPIEVRCEELNPEVIRYTEEGLFWERQSSEFRDDDPRDIVAEWVEHQFNSAPIPVAEITEAAQEMVGMAMRKNEEKPQLSYMLEFFHSMQGASRVFEYGAKKYARGNWKKGRPTTDTIDSLMRHLLKYMNGEDLDLNPETGEADENYSGLPHVDLILANALFLSEFYRTHKEMDDRDGQ